MPTSASGILQGTAYLLMVLLNRGILHGTEGLLMVHQHRGILHGTEGLLLVNLHRGILQGTVVCCWYICIGVSYRELWFVVGTSSSGHLTAN
jgi:hypothetical protein